MSTSAEPKKKRLRPLIILAMIGVVGFMAAFPFTFTTLIVRRVVALTPLAELNPEIHSASVSILGSIQLEGVTINDSEQHPVLAADKILFQFSWAELLRLHVRDIAASGVHITLKPDRNGNPTLLQLLQSDSAAGTTESDNRFVCDRFTIQGMIIAEGYALPKQTPYSATLQTSGNPLRPTYDIGVIIPDRLVLDFSTGPDAVIVRRCSVASSEFTINPATLPPALAKYIPADFKQSPLTLKVADIQAAGTWRHDGNLALAGEIKGFSGYFADDQKPAVRELNIKAERFFLKPDPSLMTFGNLVVRWESLKLPQLSTGIVSAEGSAYEGNVRVRQVAVEMAGGKINGNNCEIDFGTKTIKRVRLNISNVDQHELLKNIAPDKLDAEGRVNGSVDVAVNPDTNRLKGEIKFNSVGEGRLMIGDIQALQEQIKKKLGNAALVDLVMAQLRNYPYRSGSMKLASNGATPELTLNYQRKPLQQGDPGYEQEIEVDGKKLKANQAVQISNLTIAIPEESIENILAMAAGAEHWLAKIPNNPATAPTSTTAPSTQNKP